MRACIHKGLALLVGLLAAVGSSANISATLGERVAAAKARANDYKTKFGAVDPVFQTDASGRIIMECWAAPPEMWSKARAMALGNELLPPKLKVAKPKALPRDGSEEAYVWSDGTKLVLKAFQDKYIQVEVRAKTYTGPGC